MSGIFRTITPTSSTEQLVDSIKAELNSEDAIKHAIAINTIRLQKLSAYHNNVYDTVVRIEQFLADQPPIDEQEIYRQHNASPEGGGKRKKRKSKKRRRTRKKH
ncbi:MAG: hypothetical protein CXT73_04665 [Methanobacteriota archaeon]|nr:MAG: hypothetical protein CXT73_04665 [Euryarchaeota archaeon]